MTAAAPEPKPDPKTDPKAVVKSLRFKSLEHRYRSEAALDGGDTVEFLNQRHASRLARDAADDMEKEDET